MLLPHVSPYPHRIRIVGTYSDLQNQLLSVVLCLEGVQDRWQLLGVELDCCRVVSLIYSRLEEIASYCELSGAPMRRGEDIFIPSTTAPMTE